jgi:hypothetical protein
VPPGKGKGKKGQYKGKGKDQTPGGGRGNPPHRRGRIAPVPYVPGQAFPGDCFFCGKHGHRTADCNAKKTADAHPILIVKTAQYTGEDKRNLDLLVSAEGLNTCRTCYDRDCTGPGHCNADYIPSNMLQTAARYEADGIQEIIIGCKRTASSGIQAPKYQPVLASQHHPSEPPYYPPEPSHWHDPSYWYYQEETSYDTYHPWSEPENTWLDPYSYYPPTPPPWPEEPVYVANAEYTQPYQDAYGTWDPNPQGYPPPAPDPYEGVYQDALSASSSIDDAPPVQDVLYISDAEDNFTLDIEPDPSTLGPSDGPAGCDNSDTW